MSSSCESSLDAGGDPGTLHDDRTRTAYLRPPELACPPPAGLLLRDGLRLLVDRVGTVGARRGWRQAAPARIERCSTDLGVVARRWYPCRTDLLGVYHALRNRREDRHTPPAGSVRALAGGHSVVPVRPPRRSPGHGAGHRDRIGGSAEPRRARRTVVRAGLPPLLHPRAPHR